MPTVAKDFKTFNRKFVAGQVVTADEVENFEMWKDREFIKDDEVVVQKTSKVLPPPTVDAPAPKASAT